MQILLDSFINSHLHLILQSVVFLGDNRLET